LSDSVSPWVCQRISTLALQKGLASSTWSFSKSDEPAHFSKKRPNRGPAPGPPDWPPDPQKRPPDPKSALGPQNRGTPRKPEKSEKNPKKTRNFGVPGPPFWGGRIRAKGRPRPILIDFPGPFESLRYIGGGLANIRIFWVFSGFPGGTWFWPVSRFFAFFVFFDKIGSPPDWTLFREMCRVVRFREKPPIEVKPFSSARVEIL